MLATQLTPARRRDLAAINAELARLARYDDESIVHDVWIRQRYDGGDARRFRAGIGAMFGTDEAAAWRYGERLLTPLRPRIRALARALLVHPRHLPYPVAAAIAGLPDGPLP